MTQEQIDKHLASANADRAKRDAKESQSSLEYTLRLIMQKLESIEQRLIIIEDALVPKDQ
jgi:hypothetical protein